jgi:hypothetical protein
MWKAWSTVWAVVIVVDAVLPLHILLFNLQNTIGEADNDIMFL